MPSSGDILAITEFREYELGGYEGDASETPGARFGPSFSCPFFMLPPQVFGVDDSEPDTPIDCCGCECHPHNATGPILGHVFRPPDQLSEPYWLSLGFVGGLPQIAPDEAYPEIWAT